MRGLNHTGNAGRNRQVILNLIRERGPITRREAAEACVLSLTTGKRLIEELLREGVILEQAVGREPGSADPRHTPGAAEGGHGQAQPSSRRHAPARRGRKALRLVLNPGFGHAVGLNIEKGLLVVTAVDLTGRVIAERTIGEPGQQREQIVDRLLGETRALIAELAGGRHGVLLGVGVGVAGVINAREGRVLFCPSLPGWEEVPLAARLREQLDTPVLVDDGVRCIALAEKRYGLGRDLDSFLYLYIGRGVGAGILLDNRFYRGRNGLAGEFGHITVKESGPLCKCGNHGCLEALVSVEAILASVRGLLASGVYSSLKSCEDGQRRLTLRDIEEAAEAGDKPANMVVHNTGGIIGTGVADLVNIFDPGAVILGGEVIAHLGDHLIDGIATTVRLRGIHSITQRTRILAGCCAPEAAAHGAATMVLEDTFGSGILNL